MVNHLVESAVNDLDDNEEYNSDTEEGMYINITLYRSINGTYMIILYYMLA